MNDSEQFVTNDETLEGTQGLDEETFADESGEQAYEIDDVQLDRGVITTPYDAPIRTLLGEITEKDLIVNPTFQRQNVWGRDRQSKLIESLLLNIPIPVLYFAEDEDGSKVVVDGQQRLRAIEEYYSGRYALKKLEVLSRLNHKRWPDLTPKQSRTILGRTLRCVVISATSPASLRFEMFERLNTGGMPLNDQELRNCVFRGAFNDSLHGLVRTSLWLSAVSKSKPELRMRHEELVLRFFALRSVLGNYRPPLKQVQNEFMRSHRNPDPASIAEMAAAFERALTNCAAVFGTHCFRRVFQAEGQPERWDANVNRAVFDVQMLGFATLSTQLVEAKATDIRNTFRIQCLTNEDFQVSAPG